MSEAPLLRPSINFRKNCAASYHGLRVPLHSGTLFALVTMKDDEDDLDTSGLSICALPMIRFLGIWSEAQVLHPSANFRAVQQNCMLLCCSCSALIWKSVRAGDEER